MPVIFLSGRIPLNTALTFTQRLLTKNCSLVKSKDQGSVDQELSENPSLLPLGDRKLQSAR